VGFAWNFSVNFNNKLRKNGAINAQPKHSPTHKPQNFWRPLWANETKPPQKTYIY